MLIKHVSIFILAPVEFKTFEYLYEVIISILQFNKKLSKNKFRKMNKGRLKFKTFEINILNNNRKFKDVFIR